MIYIPLTIIIIELGLLIYFLFRMLPNETQKELQRKVVSSQGEVIEWQPEEDEFEKMSNKLTEEITK